MSTCQNIPPLDVLKSVVYFKLPASFKAMVTDIALVMDEVGDGRMEDDFLRKPLGPKRWAEFVARLEGAGWLVRLENGNLARAGILAPSDETAATEAPISADAARMRDRRLIDEFRAMLDELRQELGLAPRTKTEQPERKSRTNGSAPANKPAAETEQNAPVEPNSLASPHTRAESLTDLQTDLPTDGGTDRPSVGQTAPPPNLKMDAVFPIDDNDPQDRKMVAALTDAEIPPDVIRAVVERIPPGDRYKTSLALKCARNILKNRAVEQLARTKTTGALPELLHGAVLGGAAQDGASSPETRAFVANWKAKERKAGRL